MTTAFTFLVQFLFGAVRTACERINIQEEKAMKAVMITRRAYDERATIDASRRTDIGYRNSKQPSFRFD